MLVFTLFVLDSFGFIVRPATETDTGQPRVEPVCGYLVIHPELAVVFDTGIGAVDPETEAHYQTQRRSIELACRGARCSIDAIEVVVNSHLHFDHCGANPRFEGRP
ncbi:MBL fold metallo-hydrolase, partial [Ferrimicrobium sp.]|uniref:MBL fold metallo-hydrolase n=1 Tax=Ferrimicrobium sp. TaxID=2926050 RepID=UPI00344D6A49